MRAILNSFAILGGGRAYIKQMKDNTSNIANKINISNVIPSSENIMTASINYLINSVKKGSSATREEINLILSGCKFESNTICTFNFNDLHLALGYFDGDEYYFFSFYADEIFYKTYTTKDDFVDTIYLEAESFNSRLSEESINMFHQIKRDIFKTSVSNKKYKKYKLYTNNCAKAVLEVVNHCLGEKYKIPSNKILTPSQAHAALKNMKQDYEKPNQEERTLLALNAKLTGLPRSLSKKTELSDQTKSNALSNKTLHLQPLAPSTGRHSQVLQSSSNYKTVKNGKELSTKF